MKTKHNVHSQVNLTADEAVSAWWDCELDTEQHAALVDDILLSDNSQKRLLGYSLIGAALRGEHLERRDLAAAVRDRLHGEPLTQIDEPNNVVPLRPRTQRRWGWSGAVAASLVAGLVGVSVWMMQPATEMADRTLLTHVASLSPNPDADPMLDGLPVSVSAPTIDMDQALRMVSDSNVSAMPMPAWAQASSQTGRMDPYLMTHYETTAPQFGDVMPSARMTSFEPE